MTVSVWLVTYLVEACGNSGIKASENAKVVECDKCSQPEAMSLHGPG